LYSRLRHSSIHTLNPCAASSRLTRRVTFLSFQE
jgi:hypothetical protein